LYVDWKKYSVVFRAMFEARVLMVAKRRREVPIKKLEVRRAGLGPMLAGGGMFVCAFAVLWLPGVGGRMFECASGRAGGGRFETRFS
jgi:hypothetical protein